jgi:hypothetical protein
MKCWICGNEGATGEHLIKSSDLKRQFKKVTQGCPLYFHTEMQRNIPVGSFRAKRLKSKALICNHCNSALTQPYDRAWEKLSQYLNENIQRISSKGIVNLSKIFPGDVKTSMLNVHLFFVKTFGCKVVESGAQLPVEEFSKAIIDGKSYNYIHIGLGKNFTKSSINHAGQTEIHAVNEGDESVFASWIYVVDKIVVNVIYADKYKNPNVMKNTWHPDSITKILKLKKYK